MIAAFALRPFLSAPQMIANIRTSLLNEPFVELDAALAAA
jgi:hypothetical protein